MPIVEVPAGLSGGSEFLGPRPGDHIAYRGAVWKVVGVYFRRAPGPGTEGPATVPRVKYVILRSVDMSEDSRRALKVTLSRTVTLS